jgi:hypothetical protein
LRRDGFPSCISAPFSARQWYGWYVRLAALYLRLGMVDTSEALAAKMIGRQRADALATLAFHGQPYGKCRESLLASAMKRSSEVLNGIGSQLDDPEGSLLGRRNFSIRSRDQHTFATNQCSNW